MSRDIGSFPVPVDCPPAQPVNQVGRMLGNRTIGYVMSRWSLKFSGSPSDHPVDEFLFRLETLAEADNIPLESISLGLHSLLQGQALDYYWLFRRQQPQAP